MSNSLQNPISIHHKLLKIQSELKAPKNQINSFGNYKYRNAEDILEAIKPLLLKYDLVCIISDQTFNIGDRYYVKATVTIIDGQTEITTSAYARESEIKKGMDEAQITGAASSYARKYALNGMFLIDDTKDADSQDNRESKQSKDNRPWLNEPELSKVIMQLTEGEIDGIYIKENYRITKDTLSKIKSAMAKK